MNARAARPATKREQRLASIERILDAALSRFLARGYHSTTVDDIAREAGMTKGAVYFYFDNKSALFLTLLDEIEKLVIDGMLARLAAAGPSPVNQLVAIIHQQGALGADRSKHLVVFTIAMVEFAGANDPIEHRLKQIYERLCETIEAVVARGQATGDFHRHLKPREFTSMVLALEHGTLLEWYFRSNQLSGPELVRTARTLLLQGMLKDPAKVGAGRALRAGDPEQAS